MIDPHKLLGVSTTASAAEIELAYKRACMRYHPDRGGTHEEFVQITKAYKALKRKINICPECFGRGFTVKREGFFVKRVACPRCWK